MISVVIPTLNAERTLAATIDRVRDADQIIVADGGSSDGTVVLAERSGAHVVWSARGRGLQLHAGALAANGDWLLFLHADTVLETRWREAADDHIAQQASHAACFRFALNADAAGARVVERGVALRVRWLCLPYGDQGLLISRMLYERVGGFRALPLMEDVDLARRLGRARILQLDCAAITSAERWIRDGWLRRSGRNLACLALYGLGVSPERIARLYS